MGQGGNVYAKGARRAPIALQFRALQEGNPAQRILLNVTDTLGSPKISEGIFVEKTQDS